MNKKTIGLSVLGIGLLSAGLFLIFKKRKIAVLMEILIAVQEKKLNVLKVTMNQRECV